MLSVGWLPETLRRSGKPVALASLQDANEEFAVDLRVPLRFTLGYMLRLLRGKELYSSDFLKQCYWITITYDAGFFHDGVDTQARGFVAAYLNFIVLC